MNSKQSKALDVCYSNSCASKRLGIPPRAVEDIKRRNRREIQSGDKISDQDFSVGIGGFEVGGSLDGDISLSIPGISITLEDNGESSIEFPGNIRIDAVKDGCYLVKNVYMFDQLAYQDVELDPNCEEEIKDEEEYDAEEPESDFEEGDELEEGDSRLDEDLGPSFDEGDDHLLENAVYCCIYGRKFSNYEKNKLYPSWTPAYTKRKETYKQLQYEVRAWSNRKGVRYPREIYWTNEKKISEAWKDHKGEPGSDSRSYTSHTIDRISHEFGEPECGNTSTRFELGYGRTIKYAIKQRRDKNYRHQPDPFNSVFSGYKGIEGALNQNEVGVWDCFLSYSGGTKSDSFDTYYARDSWGEDECELLYSKIIELPEEVGKTPKQKMKKECCEDVKKIKKLVKEIHEALAVKELKDEGFQIPGRLIAPNARRTVKADNYLKILALQFQAQDHLGVHPFKASLTDANAAKAGNQKVEVQFVSGTAAMRKIVELLLENKGDGAVRLNLMVRSAIIQAQILNAVTIAAQSIKSVASFIGMPIKEKLSYIKMPFDVSLGARKAKGFDPKKTSQAIKVNTEAATEEILPKFLQSAEQPYTYEGYDGKQPSLIENIKGMGRKSQKQ